MLLNTEKKQYEGIIEYEYDKFNKIIKVSNHKYFFLTDITIFC